MATRRYKISVGQTEFSVVEEAGLATVSNNIELTVDCGAVVNDQGSTRAPSREEVLDALDMFRNWILAHNWPPV